jgi:hypothetical protein
VNDPNCIKIIAGVCSDHGYVERLGLRKHLASSAMSRKITLVTCHSTNPIYKDLPFEITSFPEVFQAKPLNPQENRRPTYTKPYTGKCAVAKSPLFQAVKEECAALGRVAKEAAEFEILKAALLKANTRLVEMKTILHDRAPKHLDKSSEPGSNHKVLNQTAEDKAGEDHERKMAPSRRRLVTKQGDTQHMIIIKYPSGFQRPLRVKPKATIAQIQSATEVTFGIPTKYQHYEIGGVPLPPSASLQEMWIGPESVLTMLPCTAQCLREVAQFGDANEWVELLAGGWCEDLLQTPLIRVVNNATVESARQALKNLQISRLQAELSRKEDTEKVGKERACKQAENTARKIVELKAREQARKVAEQQNEEHNRHMVKVEAEECAREKVRADAEVHLKRLEESEKAARRVNAECMTKINDLEESQKICALQEELLTTYRDNITTGTAARIKYAIYVEFPSGARTKHLVSSRRAIHHLQKIIADELGLPTKFQSLMIGSTGVRPDFTFEQLLIGPSSTLQMLPCDAQALREAVLSPRRNEWVTVLNGGWEAYSAEYISEKTGPMLPKLEECRKGLLGEATGEGAGKGRSDETVVGKIAQWFA